MTSKPPALPRPKAIAKNNIAVFYSSHDYLAFRLAVETGDWLATDTLIRVLVANSVRPIPAPMLAHLRQRLDGTARKRRGRRKSTDSDGAAAVSETAGSDYEFLVRCLAAAPEAWLATDTIIDVLVANSAEPIPAPVLDHLRRRLDRTATKQQGRVKETGTLSLLRDILAPHYYERYLAWLQKRRRAKGLTGWSRVRDADWWQGPPNERAARMIARAQGRGRRNVDWRHIKNEISRVRSQEFVRFKMNYCCRQ